MAASKVSGPSLALCATTLHPRSLSPDMKVLVHTRPVQGAPGLTPLDRQSLLLREHQVRGTIPCRGLLPGNAPREPAL
jgi:hypothetical protein